MMEIEKQLIEKFFDDRCTPEEAERVVRYFDNYPDELEKYISEEEWIHYKATGKLHPAVRSIAWKEIRKQAAIPRQARPGVKWWTAAAVLAMAVIGYWLWNVPRKKDTVIATVNTTITWQKIVNTGAQVKKVKLPDSSQVELQPNSALQYRHPFNTLKRLVKLEGKAFFHVHSDVHRPFTVYAGDIATTAVGTTFWVEAFAGEKKSKVRLVSGKVRIDRITADTVQFTTRYLKPGEELVFDNISKKAVLDVFELAHDQSKGKKQTKEKDDTGNQLLFENTPLTKVFERLQQQYHITIIYHKEDIQGMYFSGSYTTTDKPESILDIIVLLNNLELEKTSEGYLVRLHQ